MSSVLGPYGYFRPPKKNQNLRYQTRFLGSKYTKTAFLARALPREIYSTLPDPSLDLEATLLWEGKETSGRGRKEEGHEQQRTVGGGDGKWERGKRDGRGKCA